MRVLLATLSKHSCLRCLLCFTLDSETRAENCCLYCMIFFFSIRFTYFLSLIFSVHEHVHKMFQCIRICTCVLGSLIDPVIALFGCGISPLRHLFSFLYFLLHFYVRRSHSHASSRHDRRRKGPFLPCPSAGYVLAWLLTTPRRAKLLPRRPGLEEFLEASQSARSSLTWLPHLLQPHLCSQVSFSATLFFLFLFNING